MTRTLWRAAALLAVALLAAACSPGPPPVNSGPLGKGNDGGGICALLRPGVVFSDGDTFLQNTGGSDAVISKVGLVRPRHLLLLASYAVPINGNWILGATDGFPPALEPGIEWAPRYRGRSGHESCRPRCPSAGRWAGGIARTGRSRPASGLVHCRPWRPLPLTPPPPTATRLPRAPRQALEPGASSLGRT